MNVKISGLLFRPVKYLLLMSILLLSCSKNIHKETIISGAVTNSITGDPLNNILIELIEQKSSIFNFECCTDVVSMAYSDINGFYEIRYDVKEGGKFTYDLRISGQNSNINTNIKRYRNIPKNKETEYNWIITPLGNMKIKSSRSLLLDELISFDLSNNSSIEIGSNILNTGSTSLIYYQQLMGTWTINYKYDSDGDTTVWDWEKTDTFWVEEGQTTEYVIDVDG